MQIVNIPQQINRYDNYLIYDFKWLKEYIEKYFVLTESYGTHGATNFALETSYNHKRYIILYENKKDCPIENFYQEASIIFKYYPAILNNGEERIILTEKEFNIIKREDKLKRICDIENIYDDYSCGNCGWYGDFCDCEFEPKNINEPDGDGIYVCPECGSEQVGEITEEDFKKGNMLYGKLWRGRKING